MNKFLILIIATLFFMTTNDAFSQDIKSGEALYKKCTSCHGTDGMGKKSQNAPMLAGQFDWYLVSQLQAIKSKKRTNKNTEKMYPFVKGLSDKDFKDIAAYVSSLPKMK